MTTLLESYLFGKSAEEMEREPKCKNCGHPRSAHKRRGHDPVAIDHYYDDDDICSCGAGLRTLCILCDCKKYEGE